MMNRIIAAIAGLVVCLVLFPFAGLAATIDTRSLGYLGGDNDHPHNLSSLNNDAGAIHASAGGEDRICVFCHTPHNASPKGALWNRIEPIGPNGDGTFPLYAADLVIAETLAGSPAGSQERSGYGLGEYPNGASRLCLSCHDGVTAVGEVISGGELASLTMSAKGTINLTSSHPISFTYDAAVRDDINTVRSGYTLPATVSLDSNNRMQCTTCHDPHINTFVAATYELPMWANDTGVEDDDYSNTCDDCHGAGFRTTFNSDQGAGDGHDTPL